jgi:hypothetical protein
MISAKQTQGALVEPPRTCILLITRNTVKAAVLFSDSWPGSCLVTVFERDYNRFGTSVVDLGGYYLESSPRDCTNGGDKTNVRSNA